MNNFRDKFRRFMVGRYGTDELNQGLSIMIVILIVVNLFVRNRILFIGEVLCLTVIYLRMFSRDTSRRFQENQKYLHARFYGEEYVKNQWFRLKEKRKYKIFRCPNCRQRIRIPRGHGKIEIHCRSCHHTFIGRS